jgi:hypothetical protein
VETACALFAIATLATMAPAAQAADYTLTIKGRKFSPTELKVPANKRVVITVVDDDITPEEFESKELRVAKKSSPASRKAACCIR